jgi:hypothetical protein
MAVGAWQLTLCCLATLLFHTTSGAKSKGGAGEEDWIADFRSAPKATYDGKYKTFSKNFVRHDAETGGYTHLSYNCTVADDQFVNLDDILFGVTNVICEGGLMLISTETADGMDELGHALAHSPSGLLYGGKWSCSNAIGQEPAPIYR